MTNTLTQLKPDLFQTRTDSPFPGLTTHAYLWTGGANGNVLFYSTASDAEFDAIAELGGVADQYLSHLDEAGPMLGRIAGRFGSRLHAPAAESAEISRHAAIDVPLSVREVDVNGVEVIPTPGHSPGSCCFFVHGAAGARYLFTGDTLFPTERGTWSTFLPPGRGDADAMRSSIAVLADLQPDVVIPSAFAGPTAVHAVDGESWSRIVAQAMASVPVDASAGR
ncbi:MBL fold metallo-hydrolase [Mycolicibacterium litorale]|uniref:MBL fold metallo-hydrolase n=1 Tax=Mycolicibacterium litorale TaxID=758802 RepID=A0AAD1MRB5_9MYCO|nr:MBL fold metallo-hydrolase [Mycolicibacterium litorale]MCV7414866.1 MBL fold metallo-hydrolase [Mycolicibacterium litorale]TDY08113.1 metallo-beta-lactamase superfamily protein [Mycolicibacterium litorale]BBY16034.1 MBL fold metallo-hydrolase [Mycolicibacterium litorale]